MNLLRVAQEIRDFARSIELFIDCHVNFSGLSAESFFFKALSSPFDVDANEFEGIFDQLPHTMSRSCGNNELVRFF